MDMDLDDLLEDARPARGKPSTTAQRHTSAAMGRFAPGAGKKGADLDDLGDSFNFDDVMGSDPVPKGPQKQTTFGGGASGIGGKPPKTYDDNDDSFFGANTGSYGRGTGKVAVPATTGSRAGSFGGGSRQGSAHGSRKSQAEIEADEFDAMLDGIVQPTEAEKPAPPKPAEHIPTGTFRKNSEDGWDDLNFGSNPAG